MLTHLFGGDPIPFPFPLYRLAMPWQGIMSSQGSTKWERLSIIRGMLLRSHSYIHRRSLQPIHPTEDVLVLYKVAWQSCSLSPSLISQVEVSGRVILAGFEANDGIKPWARTIPFYFPSRCQSIEFGSLIFQHWLQREAEALYERT